MDDNNTCNWALTSKAMLHYHNHEWAVPVHDDRKLFEFLILDAFQAGLSWSTILNKRDNFRMAFDGFNWKKVAQYDEPKELELLQNKGIIRNKLKVKAAITNAKAFIKIREEFGSFDTYLWAFVGNTPMVNNYKTMGEIPATNPQAEALSKDLKKRGFKFVGPTIIYAFMQAAGLVNDHLVNCRRHKEVMAFY
ncbi:DNA-3-methyladenine glycosylase I [Saccharicrinis carchari]|uniref:DNA-3-methyladenine glycosylase I n=1 Tax=Saccharicrinis carchari TaxID=1168039 RepID=A0A521AFM0_SACCC|nr:DNA-3-methyladenine glycosylase I [Saccharicrinis carchari]SMO33510.1 DNA-3-methyladenine glycosylase I [Saccharicrinis carchari]